MNAAIERAALRATGASALVNCKSIARLWSGYGEIVRCCVQHDDARPAQSVIVKHVRWPSAAHHPRGWNTDLSHARKVRSYQIESAWYAQWAARCDESCRVPLCIALESEGDEVFIVLEDLDACGYELRRDEASRDELIACLRWLAHFHATFMHEAPEGLWPTGTYWHLATRPDELAALDDTRLKAAASRIDQALENTCFKTFVHGDAKLANFCFAADGRVAAVDFQYVGGGCGMKDVAYFIGSCCDAQQCEQEEPALLRIYFDALKAALRTRNSSIDTVALETDWRALYPFAWADFHRFLCGWSPQHWKISRYSERMVQEVLAQL